MHGGNNVLRSLRAASLSPDPPWPSPPPLSPPDARSTPLRSPPTRSDTPSPSPVGLSSPRTPALLPLRSGTHLLFDISSPLLPCYSHPSRTSPLSVPSFHNTPALLLPLLCTTPPSLLFPPLAASRPSHTPSCSRSASRSPPSLLLFLLSSSHTLRSLLPSPSVHTR